MNTVDNFFIPIRYDFEQKSFIQFFQEGIEDYFYLRGKIAYVMHHSVFQDEQTAIIREGADEDKIARLILAAIKVISYATLIIPGILLAVKACLRAVYTFNVFSSDENKQSRVSSDEETEKEEGSEDKGIGNIFQMNLNSKTNVNEGEAKIRDPLKKSDSDKDNSQNDLYSKRILREDEIESGSRSEESKSDEDKRKVSRAKLGSGSDEEENGDSIGKRNDLPPSRFRLKKGSSELEEIDSEGDGTTSRSYSTSPSESVSSSNSSSSSEEEGEKVIVVTAKEANLLSDTLSSLKPETTVKSLMKEFTKAWNVENQTFNFSDDAFKLDRFLGLLETHAKYFKKTGMDEEIHFGFVEKIVLDPNLRPFIFERADLHGDLKSLMENIRTLKDEKALNKDFKCCEGVHLIFLGDFCDRGLYGTQIIEFLMRLREENPGQVHLIRGNHEDVWGHLQMAKTDIFLQQVVKTEKGREVLDAFYQTLPLCLYMSLKQPGRLFYKQYVHGLFEPSFDPAPLLDAPEPNCYLFVSKNRVLSKRVKKIANGNSKLAKSAQRLQELALASQALEKSYTLYNWGDVKASGKTRFGKSLTMREVAFNAEDIQCYLDVSTKLNKVEQIVRGHQHLYEIIKHNGNTLVTTLPIGADSPFNRDGNEDLAYMRELTSNNLEAMYRAPGSNRTEEILVVASGSEEEDSEDLEKIKDSLAFLS